MPNTPLNSHFNSLSFPTLVNYSVCHEAINNGSSLSLPNLNSPLHIHQQHHASQFSNSNCSSPHKFLLQNKLLQPSVSKNNFLVKDTSNECLSSSGIVSNGFSSPSEPTPLNSSGKFYMNCENPLSTNRSWINSSFNKCPITTQTSEPSAINCNKISKNNNLDYISTPTMTLSYQGSPSLLTSNTSSLISTDPFVSSSSPSTTVSNSCSFPTPESHLKSFYNTKCPTPSQSSATSYHPKNSNCLSSFHPSDLNLISNPCATDVHPNSFNSRFTLPPHSLPLPIDKMNISLDFVESGRSTIDTSTIFDPKYDPNASHLGGAKLTGVRKLLWKLSRSSYREPTCRLEFV